MYTETLTQRKALMNGVPPQTANGLGYQTNAVDLGAGKSQRAFFHVQFGATVGGTVKVQTFRPSAPNALSAAQIFTHVNPKTQVSHTFTVAGMHLNAPVYPNAVTTFIIHTGKPGKYFWRCWNPCGGGDTGWTQPMSDNGYMTGTITVS